MADQGPLTALPRMIGAAREDISAIARGMQVLPELAQTLASIQRNAASLDEEVKLMRAAVDDMRTEVKGLNPRLEHVENSLRPLHRIGRRLGRNHEDDESATG